MTEPESTRSRLLQTRYFKDSVHDYGKWIAHILRIRTDPAQSRFRPGFALLSIRACDTPFWHAKDLIRRLENTFNA